MKATRFELRSLIVPQISICGNCASRIEYCRRY
ncbi:hypothetical protein Gohar_010555 [Gossypium harknessii]|uniref:Uncharacterized protein n=1 Tax=Gossypium harknessii TaxID=34285 RepID=A0A7J9GTJ2_9ROSI|nr:hypothetical protein [Gossypium harknessii]